MDVSDSLWILDRGQQAVKDTVLSNLAARRAGTASTKTKGTVAGSGKKPWRQKGTGRARAGYKSSPVWRGGGVAFGPKPRDFSIQLNRKVRSLAFARAFSERVAEGAVTILDGLETMEPKTRNVAELVKALGAPRRLLILVREVPEALRLASRNLSGVQLVTASSVPVYDVLRANRLAVMRDAWEQVETRLRSAASGRTE